MENDRVYQLELVRQPLGAKEVDQNLVRNQQDLIRQDTSLVVTVSDNQLAGSIAQQIEKVLYQSAFRTSHYPTFTKKWNALRGWQDVLNVAVSQTMILGKRASGEETFDRFELFGPGRQASALIRVSALPDNDWYQRTLYPWLYELYPAAPSIVLSDWRQPDLQQGVAPLHQSVRWENLTGPAAGYQLQEDQMVAGQTRQLREAIYFWAITFLTMPSGITRSCATKLPLICLSTVRYPKASAACWVLPPVIHRVL
ncbi:MAG: hypothetical protein HC880_07185 [Bacteroidia bacterium]|nr:hypothetical protein [Bacteroidia bacterium]